MAKVRLKNQFSGSNLDLKIAEGIDLDMHVYWYSGKQCRVMRSRNLLFTGLPLVTLPALVS